MINATNAPSSINPTLAAIEGGLNFSAASN